MQWLFLCAPPGRAPTDVQRCGCRHDFDANPHVCPYTTAASNKPFDPVCFCCAQVYLLPLTHLPPAPCLQSSLSSRAAAWAWTGCQPAQCLQQHLCQQVLWVSCAVRARRWASQEQPHTLWGASPTSLSTQTCSQTSCRCAGTSGWFLTNSAIVYTTAV